MLLRSFHAGRTRGIVRRRVTPPVAEAATHHGQPPSIRSLPDVLALVAQSVQADVIQLDIDQGTGYWRDYFIEPAGGPRLAGDPEHPPFVILRETRTLHRASPPGLVAAPDRLVQRSLPIGTAGRRRAPRSGIALLRGPARPAFKPSERRKLTLLMPHLNCAIGLAYELECARQREASALSMLERSEYGCLQLCRDGTPLQGNPLAFVLLDQARIRVGHRLLLPSLPLQRRFEAALARAGSPDCRHPLTLLMPGPPPVLMSLHPCAPFHAASGKTTATLTLTLRGQRSRTFLPDCMAQHFGLTPAEFRLCNALARGLSLKACAQKWNRSYDTLRSQLKSILAKTGTHRQPELIALLDTFRTL